MTFVPFLLEFAIMRIERLLYSAIRRAELGTRQREQAEMLLEQFRVAKKYGFVDHDFGDLDRRDGESKGLCFDEDTREALRENGFLIFRILPVSYRVADYRTKEEIEVVPEEREVAIKRSRHFIRKTRRMASYTDHLKAIQDFRSRLRNKVWTVDVVMADVATYRQLEDEFGRFFDYERSFFRLKGEGWTSTGFETFTSSQFGKKIITIGCSGAGSGPTQTELVDPDVFDATTDATKAPHWGNHHRTFMAIPVVIPATEPLFLVNKT